MNVAALFSGGKDSTYAAYVAMQRGWNVASLITVVPEDPESLMFHVPNLHLTPLLAEAMGLPLVQEPAKGGEEAELDALSQAIRRSGADAVVVGAIESDYQHSRMNQVGHELGVRVFAPLWRRDPRHLLRDYLDAGMDIRFVGCAAAGLTAAWLGRRLDPAAVEDLLQLQSQYGVHPCGEGGEFETLVVAAPWFRTHLVLDVVTVDWKGSAGHLRIDRAHLE